MVSSPSFFFPSLTKSLAHSLTHSLTHSFTHSHTRSLTHTLTHSLNSSFVPPLVPMFPLLCLSMSPTSSCVSYMYLSVHVPNILLCVIHVSLCPCPQHPPVCHTCISLSMSPTSSCVSYMYHSVCVTACVYIAHSSLMDKQSSTNLLKMKTLHSENNISSLMNF